MPPYVDAVVVSVVAIIVGDEGEGGGGSVAEMASEAVWAVAVIEVDMLAVWEAMKVVEASDAAGDEAVTA